MEGNGPSSCLTDAECVQGLQATAEKLRQPVQLLPGKLVEADCEARPTECPGRSFCKCVVTTRDGSGEVNAEAFALGLDPDCDVLDRGGQCLFTAAEFSDCEAGDTCSCAAQCEHAMTVRAAAAARSIDVEARYAKCGPYAMCWTVLRIEDRCFANGQSYDCALSDREILNRAFPPPPDAGPPRDCTHGCTSTITNGGCSVGVGVCNNCYDDAPALECSEPDAG